MQGPRQSSWTGWTRRIGKVQHRTTLCPFTLPPFHASPFHAPFLDQIHVLLAPIKKPARKGRKKRRSGKTRVQKQMEHIQKMHTLAELKQSHIAEMNMRMGRSQSAEPLLPRKDQKYGCELLYKNNPLCTEFRCGGIELLTSCCVRTGLWSGPDRRRRRLKWTNPLPPSRHGVNWTRRKC
jgi:hypothetical protein